MRHTRFALIAAVVAVLLSVTVSSGFASTPPKTGVITQFNLPPPHGPFNITVGPDGNMWFTIVTPCCETPNFDIGMLTPSGQFTGFHVPTPPSSGNIVTGPDGRLWFFDGAGANVAAMDTLGNVTEYPVPPVQLTSGPANVSPNALTLGPDGALWFTAFVESPCCGEPTTAVGRVDTGGGFTEFVLPSLASELGAITTGPDGALWFTDNSFSGAGNIGRLTTAGAFTSFPTPEKNGFTEPAGLAVGPDHNLWFPDAELNTINRMTTSGKVTAFPLKSGNPGPAGIIAGPDGAMWFSESNINAPGLGRITMQGKITEIAPPNPDDSGGVGLSTGPPSMPHTVWFTQQRSNDIDFITTK